MKTCHSFEKAIDEYIGGRSSKMQKQRLLMHVKNCAHCRGLVVSLLRIRNAQAQMPEGLKKEILQSTLAQIHTLPKPAHKKVHGFRTRYAVSVAVAALVIVIGAGTALAPSLNFGKEQAAPMEIVNDNAQETRESDFGGVAKSAQDALLQDPVKDVLIALRGVQQNDAGQEPSLAGDTETNDEKTINSYEGLSAQLKMDGQKYLYLPLGKPVGFAPAQPMVYQSQNPLTYAITYHSAYCSGAGEPSLHPTSCLNYTFYVIHDEKYKGLNIKQIVAGDGVIYHTFEDIVFAVKIEPQGFSMAWLQDDVLFKMRTNRIAYDEDLLDGWFAMLKVQRVGLE